MAGYPERKQKVLKMFLDAFSRFDQVILVDIMNISTHQIVKTKQALQKTGTVMIVGKNTIAKIALNILTKKLEKGHENFELQQQYTLKPQLSALVPFIKNKIGFIFSECSYVELKPIIEGEKMPTPAKAGTIAPADVWLREGPTHQDPGKIGEFQRMNIQVKAVKGSLEITKDIKICTKGDLVTESVSYMCRLLSIIPFEYAMTLKFVYTDGNIIPEEIISMTPQSLLSGIQESVKCLTSISMAVHLPNSLSVPHMVMDAFKKMLHLGLASGYSFKQLEDVKNAEVSAPAPTTQAQENKGPAKVEEPEEEEKSEDMDMGDLFG